MDVKDLNKYYKRTEMENIHQEIFKNSPECQYYFSGVAAGLYIAYQLLNQAPKDFCTNDLVEVIKIVAKDNKKVDEYFNRLIDADNEN